MRRSFVSTDTNAPEGFVLCVSGDGWSLHAPGSTDEEIASGYAEYLAAGPGTTPTEADFAAAMAEYCPWAAEIVKVEGGYSAFESIDEFNTWKEQNTPGADQREEESQ